MKVPESGYKRSFGPCEQEASCTGAKWGCTGAQQGLGGAKDSWETFAPWAQKSQKDLLHPPLTTFGDFPFLGKLPGPQHPKFEPRETAIWGEILAIWAPRFQITSDLRFVIWST